MHAESITIIVRQSTGTYIAKAKGIKVNASCTIGPRQAAEALVSKLGLPSDLLQEQSTDSLAAGCSRFTHPGNHKVAAVPGPLLR